MKRTLFDFESIDDSRCDYGYNNQICNDAIEDFKYAKRCYLFSKEQVAYVIKRLKQEYDVEIFRDEYDAYIIMQVKTHIPTEFVLI